jgi:hypothetical protein
LEKAEAKNKKWNQIDHTCHKYWEENYQENELGGKVAET